jgi:hypothetical protein
MDPITYLFEPASAILMQNVTSKHARFFVRSAKVVISVMQEALYINYDAINNKAARQFLLASFTSQLNLEIAECLDDHVTFQIIWLQIIKAILSTSIGRFNNLKNMLKS